MCSAELRTERLRLRRWRSDDRKPFSELNADADVMEFYPALLTRSASDAFVDRIERTFDELDIGLWAVEIVDGAKFIGYVGLWPATFEAHFTPAIEVGWRLAKRFWGQGLAPEAARVAVRDGFERLGLAEIVSFTAATNLNSRRVMEKIGMSRDLDGDFDHPSVALGDPLRRHVLYRLEGSGLT